MSFYEKYAGLPQASTEVIPPSIKPSRFPKPMQVEMQNVEVVSSSGARDLGGSAQISVPLNPQAGICAEKTAYLKLVFTPANGAANPIYFRGSCANVQADTLANQLSTGTAYSLINPLQIIYNNAQVINITNFDRLMDGILAHSANSTWMSTDATILLGAGVDVKAGQRTFILPLPSIFSAPRSVPLWAGSGALQIQVDFNNPATSCYCVGGALPADFTGSIIASLCYTRIDPPADFVMQGKTQLAQGVYTLPYVDYQVVRLDRTGNQNYIHPVSSSSLRSVHFTNLGTNRLASTVAGKNSLSSRSFDAHGDPTELEGMTNIQVYLDGKPVNGYTLATASSAGISSSQVFGELQKVFGRLYDSQRADNCIHLNSERSFDSSRFMVGVSTTKFTDGGFDLTGSPVGNVMVQYTTGATGGQTQFLVFTMDKILAIDAVGSAQVLN